MRQFKTWTNKQEAESVKLQEDKAVVQRIEFRNTDRVEKSIAVECYTNKQAVTKDFYKRQEIKPFGIGASFDDLKTNNAITTVQRENVWHPFYEVVIEEMDFAEKMKQAAEDKKRANVGGAAITELQ